MKTFRLLIGQLSKFNPGSQGLRALATLLVGLPLATLSGNVGKTFASPDDAVASFAAAIRTQNPDELRAVLGPDSEDLENPDRVQATNEFRAVARALEQRSHL